MASIKTKARFAGLLYLALGFIAPVGLVYVPGKLIVLGDPTETGRRILASEWLFRLGIASELISPIVCLFVVMALHDLLKDVDERRARLMVILGALLPIPISLINVLNSIAALSLFKGTGHLSAFDRTQLDSLGMTFIGLRSCGISIASIFWGLWLFPFGILVVRSRFIPRILGYLLFAAGLGYLASAFASLVLPTANVFGGVATAMEMGELPIILYLVTFGARPWPDAAPDAAAARGRAAADH
ncbi:MAG TPA: DUF4386 domain-containing protein [Anaeromyxobacteraceae bacterium]|nr:DUF4386 domain-containing protein [Anaeromyxobacteraceae bacterium]